LWRPYREIVREGARVRREWRRRNRVYSAGRSAMSVRYWYLHRRNHYPASMQAHQCVASMVPCLGVCRSHATRGRSARSYRVPNSTAEVCSCGAHAGRLRGTALCSGWAREAARDRGRGTCFLARGCSRCESPRGRPNLGWGRRGAGRIDGMPAIGIEASFPCARVCLLGPRSLAALVLDMPIVQAESCSVRGSRSPFRGQGN
jgi:hypothetical protein